MAYSSEQAHHRAMIELAELARANGVAMVPGAGLYPGLSGLLLLDMLADAPDASEATMVMVTGLPETPDSGIASLLAGALELSTGEPLGEYVDGSLRAVTPTMTGTFPVARFGEVSAVRWPSLEIPVLRGELGGVDLRTYAALGGAPAPTAFEIALLRLLRPDRRGWAYRLLRRYAQFLNARLYRAGLRRDWGHECVVQVNVSGPGGSRRRELVAEDMAPGTCFLATETTQRLLAAVPPPPGGQPRRTPVAKPPHQSLDLANAQAQLPGRLALPKPPRGHRLDHPNPVQLPMAQCTKPL